MPLTLDCIEQVYKRERLSCGIKLPTQLLAMLSVIVPHVVVQAVLQAVIFIPWVNLNSSGLCLKEG